MFIKVTLTIMLQTATKTKTPTVTEANAINYTSFALDQLGVDKINSFDRFIMALEFMTTHGWSAELSAAGRIHIAPPGKTPREASLCLVQAVHDAFTGRPDITGMSAIKERCEAFLGMGPNELASVILTDSVEPMALVNLEEHAARRARVLKALGLS